MIHRTVGRILAWGAGIVLGVFFAVGYAAAYLPPEGFWWMEPFAVLLPMTSVLLIGVTAGGWVLRRTSRLRGGVAAAVLVLVAVRFGPYVSGIGGEAAASPEGDAATDSTRALRVMTFNAPFVGGDAGDLAAGVRRVVRTEAPDVLALQEPFVTTSAAQRIERVSPQLRELVGETNYRLPGALPEDDRVSQLVLSLTPSLPPADSLSHYRLDEPSSNPFVSRVPFQWRGRRVVLYNVHLHTTVGKEKPWRSSRFRIFDLAFWTPVLETYRTGAQRRAEQARRLRRMIEAETGPVIVAGDFNSTRHHWVYRHVAAAEGMQDAHRVAGRGLGWTFPAERPLVRIDHVLVSHHWQVVDAHVSPHAALSDHRPVVARLRWSATRERGER